MDAWKTYRSLSPEQKEILARKQLELNRPVDELLALLKPIAACDRVANKAQTLFGCTFALFLLFTFIGLLFFSFIGWGPLAFGALLLFLAGAFATGWFLRWLKRIDVSDNLRKFVIPVLAIFREDIDPATPVHLRLDLTRPTLKTKKQSEGVPYKHGAYYKVIDTMYVDPWMDAEAVLVDGTRLRWSLTDRIRERQKTKRNPRGKIKSKTKYRKVTDVEVQLALKSKTYSVTHADAEAAGNRSKVAVRRSVRTDSLDPVSPRALIDAVTEVYRSLKPAKEAHA